MMFLPGPGSVGRQAHLNARCTPEEEAQKEAETRSLANVGISQNGRKKENDRPIIVYDMFVLHGLSW